MMLAEIIVEDDDGNVIRNDPALKILRNPNDMNLYLEVLRVFLIDYITNLKTYLLTPISHLLS
jgi:hypothetical protein